MKTPLLPHQQRFVEWAKSRNQVANFGEPGVGKTLMALAWLEVRDLKHTLWVTVNSYVQGTVDEIRKHTDFVATTEIESTRVFCKSRGTIRVMPYTALQRYRGAIDRQQLSYDAVILDESHAIKRIQAKRTQLALRYLRHIENRMIMSGTPATNDLLDLWSQFKFLNHGYLLGCSRDSYIKKWFHPFGLYRWEPNPGAVERINRVISPITFWCRKAECLDLPPIVRKRVPIACHHKTRKLYDQLSETFAAELESGAAIDTVFAVKKFTRLLQMLSGRFVADDGSITKLPCTKYEAVKSLLAHLLLDMWSKVVVWCRFAFEVEDVAKFSRKAVHTFVVAGDSDVTDQVRQFQAARKPAMIVLTLAKGSEAITLTEASYAVYYGRDFSVARRLQSQDRTHRVGAEKHKLVTYYDVYTKDTIEESSLNDLGKKAILAIKTRNGVQLRRYLQGKIGPKFS